MRLLKRLFALLIAGGVALGLTLAAVSVAGQEQAVGFVGPSQSPSIRRSYRESADVVLAACISSYVSPSGSENSLFRIETVYDGELEPGALFTLSRGAVEGENSVPVVAAGEVKRFFLEIGGGWI